MKKYLSLSLILLCISLLLCSCGDSKAADSSNTANASVGTEAVTQQAAIDIDLTKMSSTMIYSKVYDMLDNPDAYVGKTVKMKGSFAAYDGSEYREHYFACVIADATACCQQGLEFRLKDGLTYPDDYPTIGKNITVIGTFNTYMEGEQKYAELKDSTIVS